MYLPSPPTRQERELYFGPQRRWIPVLSFLSSVLVVLSMSLFMHHRPDTWFLVIPVGFSALGSCISLISSTRKRRSNLLDHDKLVEGWQPDFIASIDVFLPTAGEDIRVLRNTYDHVSRLRWPGELRVLVLDDGARREVQELAAEYGFDYNVRSNRGVLKKAGNLLSGFERTDGDFILVLDADFVPSPNIFFELLPYMDDPKNGIIQSPQFFDFDRSMSWIQRAAGGTQVLFYKWIQPSRDRSNAAICVGTCAIYRRAALESAGGFAQIGHSEDVHTGVNLMSAGYQVRYIPIVVSKGICPDGFDQFVTQQYRWCTGSMSLLFSRRFHKHAFSFMQRLSYWSGFSYYISTGLNVFFLAVAPIFLGLLAPEEVRPSNYILIGLALLIRMFIVPMVTQGRMSIVTITRIQMTYSFAHALALFDQMKRHSDAWVATGDKKRSVTAVRVGRLSRSWCLLIQITLWSILAWRIPSYGIENYWPMIALALFNLYLIVPIVRRSNS